MDPMSVELMKKSPTFMDKIAAMIRVRGAMRTNNFSQVSDFDKEVVNGMTSSDISTQLGYLNNMQSQESAIIKALTAARVATPQAAAATGQSQEDLQATMNQSNPINARVQSQQKMQAQTAVNKDTLMNAYKQRLDGAARVNDLLQAADSGKVVTNAAFLGQLNAEIARLETGSQAPGLGASEKTELKSAQSQFEGLKERITGNPTDSVSPGFIKQVHGTMDSMIDSYQQSVNDRYATIASGLTEVQKPIVKDKWNQDVQNYTKRFGRWAPGIAQQAAATAPNMSPADQLNQSFGAQAGPTQVPPKKDPAQVMQYKQQAMDRIKQIQQAQKAGYPISTTVQQVRQTYKNLTGQDLEQ
jgi:hypothetical protein